MAQQQLIMAIGRIERALSRMEQLSPRSPSDQNDPELLAQHERLKAETSAAIADIDRILAGDAN